MIKFLIPILYAFILMSAVIYLWHKLLDRKLHFKNYKLYVVLLGMMLTSLFNFFSINSFVRITFNTICLIFFFSFLFRKNLQISIITPIFSQIIIGIAEILYTIILMLIFGANHQELLSSYFGTFITNVIISIILVGFSHLKFIKKVYFKILKFTDKINYIKLSTFCIITMLIANILFVSSYYKIKFEYLFTFNVIMTLICFVIMFYSFRTQSNYNKVSDKYNVATNSLKDYENMMNKYRIANHENKNLMLTIRAMVLNKEKNIPQYIDSIVEERYNDDEKLLFKMSVIPSGGLRATIYSEILKIKENGIDYSLDIDKAIKTIDLIELGTNTVIEICKIIGVFIDNAIDEVKNNSTKLISISIFTIDNVIKIKVSNTYKGLLNLNLIGNEGYTTKGNGHGYGLSLVKRIIEKNPIFTNEMEINKKVFSQTLSIEYKRT